MITLLISPRRAMSRKWKVKTHQKQKVDEAESDRMKGLMSLCVSGIMALYWSGAAAMLMDMPSTHAFCLTLCFLIGVLCMVTGGIVATFPGNAHCKMGISGVGAWTTLIFTLGSFHLATFKLHEDLVYSIISMVICFILITTFWGIVAQDPVVLHIFAKYVVWFICKIIDYAHQTRCLQKAREMIKPLTLKLVAVYNMARYFLPNGPPFLPERFLTDITKKGYEKDCYHGKRKQEFEESRVAEYLATCMSGLMCM